MHRSVEADFAAGNVTIGQANLDAYVAGLAKRYGTHRNAKPLDRSFKMEKLKRAAALLGKHVLTFRV